MDRNPASRFAAHSAPSRAMLLPLALLAGCASPSGDYPSLAIREAERVAGTLPPAEPEPYVPPAPSSTVLGRADTLADAAGAAHAAFLAEAQRASATVQSARGAATGSENWARAEVALASLVSARSMTMVPLADLDRLLVDAAVEGQALASISAARDAAQQQVAEEDATIGRLQQLLAP